MCVFMCPRGQLFYNQPREIEENWPVRKRWDIYAECCVYVCVDGVDIILWDFTHQILREFNCKSILDEI